jgi:hypothetical protein
MGLGASGSACCRNQNDARYTRVKTEAALTRGVRRFITD